MSLIKGNTSTVTRKELLEVLTAAKVNTAHDCATYFTDPYDNPFDTEYVVRKRYTDDTKRTMFQRINCLWLIPVWIIVVIPVMYIVRGDWKIDEYSRTGLILKKIIGELF